MRYKKPKYIALRMALVALLVALFAWVYWQFLENYRKVEISNKMVEAFLDNKTELAAQYAQELGMTKETLNKTRVFLDAVEKENVQLKEKVKLLDTLSDLQEEIGRLRQENADIAEQMVSLKEKVKKEEEDMPEFKTIDEGQTLLGKMKKTFQAVKDKIGSLKRKEHQRKIRVQEEVDKLESMAGNNGYMVKDGQMMKMDMPPVNGKNIQVNVEFVK